MLATLDDTGIDKSAHERLAGMMDGKLGWTGFWNPAAGGGSAVITPLFGLEALAIWGLGSAEGSPAFGIEGLVTQFNPTRAAGGALTLKATVEADAGQPAIWGFLGANATDASAANHAAMPLMQAGNTLTITAITKAANAVVTAAGHGYANGDTVFISGTNSSPVLDGGRTVANATTDTFTVGVDTSGAGSAGTAGSVYRTSTRYGGAILVLCQSIGSGNVVVKLQDSADGGTYADVTSVTTANLNATTSAALIVVTGTALWRGYLRLASSGTFTNAAIVGLIARATGTTW